MEGHCRHSWHMKQEILLKVSLIILLILIIYPAISGAQYYPFSYGGNTWSYSSYPSWGWNSLGYYPCSSMFNPFSTYSYPSYGNYFDNNSFGYPYGNNSYSYPTWGNYLDNNSFGYPYTNNSYSLYNFQPFMNPFSSPYGLNQYYLNPFDPIGSLWRGEIFHPTPSSGYPDSGYVTTPSGSIFNVGGPYG